jgi:hypothetical protein
MGFSTLVLAGAVAVMAAAQPDIPDPPAGTYRYAVSHPMLGEIGTMTTTVRRAGDETEVATRLDIDARFMWMSMRRLTGERLEVWKGATLERLVGHTEDNGSLLRIEGHRRDGRFVIDGPSGRLEAPGDAVPGNPWSVRITRASAIIGTEHGTLTPVSVSDQGEEEIDLPGARGPMRHFSLRGASDGDVWFSRAGIAVKFNFTEDDGTPITFRLQPLARDARQEADARFAAK